MDLGGLQDVLQLLPVLQATRPPGVVDVVPGAASILLTCDPAVLPLADLRAWALTAGPLPPGTARRSADAGDAGAAADPVEVTVRYDGEDLGEVARLLGLSPREVVRQHTGVTWTVAFTGFTPGFGYLVPDPAHPAEHAGPTETAGHPLLAVPRRASPRPRVPAGAVGLAGGFSGVYPRACPGGWQLIGTTGAVLWDPGRRPAALLAPGARVRFTEAAS